MTFNLLVFGLLTLACGSPETVTNRAEVEAPVASGAGMVSSAHPLATQAGLDILSRGGNAFDAAVAVAATLNVVEPAMSGIGGYGTILIHDTAVGETRFLNASGRIPRAVDADVFRSPTPNYKANRVGPKAISTPGNARAWEALWTLYGNLPPAEILAPAIRAAEEGFTISPRIAHFIARAFDEFPDHVRAFYGRDGKPLGVGERLVQKDLGRTLRAIAEHGADGVYSGEIGRAIDQAMRQAGSFLTLADLEESAAEWYEPISIDYRGYQVLTAAPPATAFPSLIRLGLMSRFDVAALGHNSTNYLHRFAEMTKHAFWCRLAHAGDPELKGPPLEHLLSEAYWHQQAELFDPERATVFEPPTPVVAEGMNTTHFVVADGQGNIVSATQTLGNLFGSRIMVEGTGIWLNNSLAYCTFEPKGNPMDAHAGHHKLSGDCPTIILRDGRPWVALGTPGGHTIGQTVPQMVMNLIDFGMDVENAVAAARVSFVEPDLLAVEEGVPEEVRQALEALGHKLSVVQALGNAHALSIDYDAEGRPVRFVGAADPRGEGTARGL